MLHTLAAPPALSSCLMTSSFHGTCRLTKEFQTSSSPTIHSPRLPAKLLQQLHYHKQYPINSLPEPSRFWKRCKKAKEEGLENKCTEVENPSHNAKHMYKKIKENVGGTTAPPSKYIKAVMVESCMNRKTIRLAGRNTSKSSSMRIRHKRHLLQIS